MRILFLSARLPYPPLHGDEVRGYHQLRLLSQRHDVTLLSFTDRHNSAQHTALLAPFCERIVTVPRRGLEKLAACVRNAWTRYPFQTLLYQSRRMAQAVRTQLASSHFDMVHVQLARMAPYVEHLHTVPRVIDLIDALSMNMQRRSLRERGVLKLAARLESRRLAAYEREICRKFDRATVVSSLDRETIGDFDNLHVNPVAVDLARFPFCATGRDPCTLVFSGNMSYFPNIHAVKWFAERVWPQLKSQLPEVRWKIVGVDPPRDVQRLGEHDPAIVVTGYVPDIHAHLNRATVAIVPLQAGSGMQFKVIESMAAGTPLVVTPFALGGIDVVSGRHLLVARDAENFAGCVVRLLQDTKLRHVLAVNARRLVEEKYCWERSVEMLEDVYALALQSETAGSLAVKRLGIARPDVGRRAA